ncbi:hypothetical protein [Nostoc sp. ChiSLP03a]|uniref:hypothetical protein n=1 Tax=Nostoc sp. ChiSLP03a TaxID=3075380 RepID=UPI002AD249D9|nr:hypothetical protein [Nostoc sp. ChiSLP03a]MDZ8211918.1 hypothetical protein [Nostoc sp. ChiSLP03a]
MSLSKQIIDLQSTLHERAKELCKAEIIKPSQLTSISNDCQTILNLAKKINSIELNDRFTEMEKAAEEIKNATDSLDKAAAKIQDAQKFFEILSPLIQLVQAVPSAITNSSVATIGNLAKQLRGIGDQLNT